MKEFKITYIAPPISEIPKIIYIRAENKYRAANKLALSAQTVEEIINIEEQDI